MDEKDLAPASHEGSDISGGFIAIGFAFTFSFRFSCDCFFVSNLWSANICFNLKLSLHSINNNIKMQLSHTRY